MKRIDIYTDGACSGNPGKGGAAWLALDEKGNELFSGSNGYRHTTNNRMELVAVIWALYQLYLYIEEKSINTDIKVTVYSDSQMVVETFNKGWSKNKNKDLWDNLDLILSDSCSARDGKQTTLGDIVTFAKVKGHSGNNGNDRVDAMAVKAYMHPKHMLREDAKYEEINAGVHDKTTEETDMRKIDTKQINLINVNDKTSRSVEIIFTDGARATFARTDNKVLADCLNEKYRSATVEIFPRLFEWLNGGEL